MREMTKLKNLLLSCLCLLTKLENSDISEYNDIENELDTLKIDLIKELNNL